MTITHDADIALQLMWGPRPPTWWESILRHIPPFRHWIERRISRRVPTVQEVEDWVQLRYIADEW